MAGSLWKHGRSSVKNKDRGSQMPSLLSCLFFFLCVGMLDLFSNDGRTQEGPHAAVSILRQRQLIRHISIYWYVASELDYNIK